MRCARDPGQDKEPHNHENDKDYDAFHISDYTPQQTINDGYARCFLLQLCRIVLGT